MECESGEPGEIQTQGEHAKCHTDSNSSWRLELWGSNLSCCTTPSPGFFFFNSIFKRVSFVSFEIFPVIIHFLNIITTLACSSILLYMFRSGDWKSWQNFFLWFFFFVVVGFVLIWILQEIPLFSSSFFSFQNNGECKILHSITCPALKGEFITFWIKEKQCSKALDLSSRSLQFLDYLLD